MTLTPPLTPLDGSASASANQRENGASTPAAEQGHKPASDSNGNATAPVCRGTRLLLLGRPKLISGDSDLIRQIKYRKGVALLGYLASHANAWHSRERLADLLWPELNASVARTNLRQVLNNLTAVLQTPSGYEALQKDNAAVAIVPHGGLRIDIELLSDTVLDRIKNDTPDDRLWRRREIEPWALALGDEFLEGLYLPDAPEFQEWLEVQRTRFRERSALLLECLCRAQHAEGRQEEAVATARHLVALDPFDERRNQLLISMLAESGNASAALEAFNAYRQRLENEMGAQPGPALIAMRDHLVQRLEKNTLPSRLHESAEPEMRHIAALYCAYGTANLDEVDENFAEQVESVVRKWGGTLTSGSGRGVLGVFGLGESVERATQRALLAARDLQAAISGKAPCPPCMGISSGRILLRRSAEIPQLAGDIPDLAKFIGWSAQPGEILVSEAVAQLGSDLFTFGAAGEGTFHGFTGSHRLYRLTGAVGTNASVGTPFFGHAAEIARLRTWWEDAVSGKARVAVLRAPAGLGKTRLATEVTNWVERHGGRTRRFQCCLEHQHEPLAAVRAGMGTELASIAAGNTPKTAVFEALISLLTEETAHQPTLLVVDDLHWSDLATREFLGLLMRRLESRRMLLLVTTRPEVVIDYPARITEVIDLAPLDETDSLAVIAACDQENAIPANERIKLANLCSGNPLFLERQIRERLEGGYHCQSIAELLQSELDRLGGNKAVLHAASALGERFSRRHLLDLLPDADVTEALARAKDQNLISLLSGDRCAFRHALIRDAAYESLTPTRRRLLHDRIARLFIGEPESSPEEIAGHLSAAGCRQEAREWWLKAGDIAMEREFAGDAMASYRQALEQASDDNADKAVTQLIRMRLGYAAHVAEGYGSPLTYRLFAEMVAEIEARPDPDRRQLFAALAGCYMGGSSFAKDEGLAIAERLHALADTDAERLMAFFASGNTLFWLGQFETAAEWQHKCMALAGTTSFKDRIRFGVDDPAITCCAFSGWTQWFLGEEAAACASATEAIALARKGKRAHALCFALVFGACLHWYRRDIAGVASLAGEALALAKEHGFPLWEGGAGLLLLWAQAASGTMTDTSALFGAATMLQQALPSRVTTSRWIAIHALLALNEWEEAEKLLDIALREVEFLEEQYCVADLLRLKGECLDRRGLTSDAREFHERGLALARRQGAKGLVARFR